MKEEKSLKFREMREETYEQLLRIRYNELVQLAAAFKQVLGKEKILHITEELYSKMGIETVTRVKEIETMENFDDFAEYFKNSLIDLFSSHVLTVTIEEKTSLKLSLKNYRMSICADIRRHKCY